MAASGGKEMEIAIKIAGKVENSFKSAIGAATKGLGSITKAVSVATAAAAAAVGAIGMAAINTGREFEGAMSQVAATMLLDKTTAEGQKAFEALEDAARKCGASTAFSATEAAEALNYLALAGYDADKAAKALPTVLKLAGAGAMDLAAASDMVTDSMSALEIEATKANLTQFSDQLAQTASKANTSVAQLGEAILTVGGTAKGLAGGTTELNTALGILADNGLKGAEGGTHLRNIILSLQNPTDKAAASLQSLGVDVYDAQGNMRGLNDVFKDLQGAMAGMDNASKDSILSTLFNKTDLTAANAMLSNCTNRFDELSAAVEDSTGACENMYAIQLDNLNGDIDILKSGLSDLGISIYQDLNGPLREMTQLATSMVGELSEAYKSGGMEGMVGAVGNCFSELISEVASYAPEVMEMGMTLVQSLIWGIAENAREIGKSGAELGVTFATGLSDMLPAITNAAFDIIAGFADGLLEGDNLTKITDAGIEAVSGFAQAIIDHLPELTEAGGKIIQQLITGILSGSDGSFADIATRIGILAFAIRPLSGLLGKATGLFSGLGSAASVASTPLKAAGGGLGILTANAKGLVSLGAGFLMVAAGIALITQSAIGIASAGPGAAVAFVLLAAAVAGMAVGAVALAPAMAAGAVGLVAFGAGVTLVGVGILAATAGISLLASQLPNIAAHGASAATAIMLISSSLVLLSGGTMAAAAGLIAMFFPMVGGVASAAALGVALTGLTVSATLSLAAIVLLTASMAALGTTMSSIKTNAAEAMDSITNMQTGVDVISAGLNAIQTIAADALSKFASIFQQEAPNVADGAKSIMQKVNHALSTGWNTAMVKARSAASAIKAAFENMTIIIPKPKVPVISVSTNSVSYGDGGSVSVPQLSVNWNALGGILDRPTIFNTSQGMQGVGEAGPEAILPLDALWAKMKEILNEAIAANSGASLVDAFIEKLKGIGSGGGQDTPEFAGAGGPTIQYSPTYNLYGSAGKDEIAEADRISQAEFNKLMKQYERDQKRRKL